MLFGGIAAAVVVAAVAAVVFSRRRSFDDDHSVEGYHRQLHTLESMSAHPAGSQRDEEGADGPKAAYPESAVRLAGASTVRLLDGGKREVPPVAPPVVVGEGELVKFDDAGPISVTLPGSGPGTAAGTGAGTANLWRDDRTMQAINKRPRRLAAPAMAIAAVTVLIVVLLVTGSHQVPPVHHPAASLTHHPTRHTTHRPPTHRPSTTTTVPLVSLPKATSTHDANYLVSTSDYTLLVSATQSACWIDATNMSTGASVFAGVIPAGSQQTFDVTGPFSVAVGAPSSFAATINGSPVTLPFGYQTPFTLHFTSLT